MIDKIKILDFDTNQYVSLTTFKSIWKRDSSNRAKTYTIDEPMLVSYLDEGSKLNEEIIRVPGRSTPLDVSKYLFGNNSYTERHLEWILRVKLNPNNDFCTKLNFALEFKRLLHGKYYGVQFIDSQKDTIGTTWDFNYWFCGVIKYDYGEYNGLYPHNYIFLLIFYTLQVISFVFAFLIGWESASEETVFKGIIISVY